MKILYFNLEYFKPNSHKESGQSGLLHNIILAIIIIFNIKECD